MNEIVFGQKHYFLTHFWRQLWNSVFIAGMTGILTLLIATFAAFAPSGGAAVFNACRTAANRRGLFGG